MSAGGQTLIYLRDAYCDHDKSVMAELIIAIDGECKFYPLEINDVLLLNQDLAKAALKYYHDREITEHMTVTAAKPGED